MFATFRRYCVDFICLFALPLSNNCASFQRHALPAVDVPYFLINYAALIYKDNWFNLSDAKLYTTHYGRLRY